MVSKLRLTTARLWLCALTLLFVGQIRHNSRAQGTLTLSQPTYNCSTGAITFNTSGGNGSTITYSAAGITRDNATNNSGTVEQGLRTDPKPIVITATQGGSSTSYTFNLAAFCATPSNRAPVYNGSIGTSTGIVGRTFYYYIPTGAFTDPEGQVLTYSATGMPAGIIIDPPTGTVYGTVSTTGVSTITITATDPGGLSTSGQLIIGFNPEGGTTGGGFALTQPTYNCSTGAITFNNTGGNGSAITYTVPGVTRAGNASSTGTVEAGLRADPKPLIITATQGGAISVYTFDLASFCSTSGTSGTGTTGGQSFSGTLGATTGTVGQAFTYTLPTGALTGSASQTLGTGQSLTYSATGLPAGLTINPSTGAITGTPTTAGSSTVVIRSITPGISSTVSSGTSTTGTSGTGTSGTATSGTGTSGTSTVGQSASGTLGIVISSSVTSSTSTTGTSGTGTSGTGTSGGTAFAGTLGSATGTVGQAFVYNLPLGALTGASGQTLTGGQTFTYSATGLPAGLTLNAGTGAITGTPTTAGSSTVLITSLSSGSSTSGTSGTGTSTTGTSGTGTSGTATSGTGTSGTGTSGTATVGQSFSGTLGILINSSATSGTSTSGTAPVFSGSLVSATGTVGQVFSYTLPTGAFTSSGGQSLSYNASGVPLGLSINAATGAISGTPTQAGNNAVVIFATNPGGQSASALLGITISSSVTSGTSTTGTSGTGTSGTGVVFSGTLISTTITAGQGFSYTLPTGAFTGPTGQTLTYSATGLPTGLTINSATGAISGTPTTAGSNTVVIRATSTTATSGSSTTGTSGTGTSGSSTVGTSASATLGLTVVSSTVTSGTSTTGTSGTGTSGTATTGVAFSGSLVSTTGVVGRAFSYTLPTGTFTGPTGQSLTYSATGLPAGLSINAGTGAITGTPTTTGSSTVVIRALSSGSSTSGTSGTGTSGTATSGTGTSGTGTSGTATSGTVTSGTGTSGTAISGTSTAGQSASGTLTITISASTAGGRIATELTPIDIVATGGNPIANGIVEVAVTGVVGEAVDVLLTDSRGRIIGQQRRERASVEERFRFDVGNQPGGIMLLRAATANRANTLRLIKVD